MEQLDYTIDGSTLARILGRDNFTTAQSAVLELVKNAYDAGASYCEISLSDSIVIKDDGKGMNSKVFHQDWMHVGSSQKTQTYIIDVEGRERVLSGSMGLGRFALARLGMIVDVYSKVIDDEHICHWHTDWDSAQFEIVNTNFEYDQGTCIKITNLNDKWTKKPVEKLCSILQRSWCDSNMKITVKGKNTIDRLNPVYENLELGRDYATEVSLNYRSSACELKVDINCDEFNADAQVKLPKLNLKHHGKVINIFDEFKTTGASANEENQLETDLQRLGDFSAKLFFGLTHNIKNSGVARYYKYSGTGKKEAGIAVYRDAFSVASLDGRTDWLGLDRRARKSPASASHPTGSWRVRRNQLFGFVKIDRRKNPQIKDLANRQGVEENNEFEYLKQIVDVGIETFERYRQSIIRQLDNSDSEKEDLDKKWMNTLRQFVSKPTASQTYSETGLKDLSRAVSWSLNTRNKLLKEAANLRYDKQILNLFATQGLRAAAAAHETEKDKRQIGEAADHLRNALEQAGVWGILNEEENTRTMSQNVPQQLKDYKKTISSVMSYMDALLTSTEKSRFEIQMVNVNKAISNIANRWSEEYGSAKIHVDIDSESMLNCSLDTFDTIFDNLILNSMQQNANQQDYVLINISCVDNGGSMNFTYTDNGVGLPDKFKSCPEKILEVHQSSRSNGHGLGMWIVNNEIQMYNGRVENIGSNRGFLFKFSLCGKEINNGK